jgi:Repeat of unknown function (DUF5650)
MSTTSTEAIAWRGSSVRSRFLAACGLALLVSGLSIGVGSRPASAVTVTQFDLLNPAGSQPGSQFGQYVTVLPNGNIVATDPSYDRGATVDVGAVYLFNGTTRVLTSTLTGTTSGDSIGNAGVLVLSNGNFLVASAKWDNGASTDAGAVTWASGTAGVSGAVSALNSLVGATSNDTVGVNGFANSFVVGLSNGNYLVRSPQWDNGTAVDAGAVTWGSGATGVSGVVNAGNSLVGTTTGDNIGGAPLVVPDAGSGVFVLPNSNYVVTSRLWDNGTVVDAGAATWGNGAMGTTGVVSVTNSLVGTTLNDNVGGYGVVVLSNGNYLVESLTWDNAAAIDAGAVTWGNGATGVKGVLSSANSLVGTTSYDRLGYYGVSGLSNGNYVVGSQYWDNGAAVDAGAVTWGNGATGIMGAITSGNSLVGTKSNDSIGGRGVYRLPNGNYVVSSQYWDNGPAVDAGAATWGNGTTGVKGAVTALNSLVGATSNDNIGESGIYGLSNGSYVVMSQNWDNGTATNAGAATWGNGTSGISGVVSSTNSLVGTTSNDSIGIYGQLTELSNGNYVVSNPFWNNGPAIGAGAVTWGSSTAGVKGAVSPANSLVGTTSGDRVSGVEVLSNGNYLVRSWWTNGPAIHAGSVTLANGATGTSGAVSALNSLVGSATDDYVGGGLVSELANGSYIVHSPSWDNGTAVDAGAVTWGNGISGVTGPVSASNSLVGTRSGDGIGSRGIGVSTGNYVVDSPSWDNGAAVDAGAVTWGNITTGTTGAVTASNSLVGTTSGDSIGSEGVANLPNGNYLVHSPKWDNGPAVDAGAVTWFNATTGLRGAVAASNSLVGSTTNDHLGEGGYGGVVTNGDGSYVVPSALWDNGSVVDAGAVTYGPATGISGVITRSNSVIGTPPGSLGRIALGRTTAGAYVISTSQDRVLLLSASDLTWVDQTLAPLQVGAAYSDAVSATGSSPATYTVSAGALPVGVTLNGSTGALAGTPTTAGPYSFTITASNTVDPSITASFNGTVAAASAPAATTDFVPLSPGRLADTRPTGVTVDNQFAAGGARAAGSTFEIVVAGRGGVPATAQTASLNITAVDPTSDGYATVFPCGSAQPNASNLNYTGGHNRAGGVITKIGSSGKVCIFVSQATHLIVDVNGSFPASSSLVSANPARVLDTRPTGATVDNQQQAAGLRSAGSTTTVTVGGRAGIPVDAKAAVMTVTVTGTTSDGYLTVYPCGSAVPNSSNLNYTAGTDIANLVISKLGTSGTVCIYSSAATHLIVDVTGYFPAGSSYEPLQPARLLETRAGSATIDNLFNGAGLRPAGTVTELTVTGRGVVAANAATVVLNVTATGPTADGFVSVYPCGITPPNASNLNVATGETVANTVITKVGSGGKVCVYNSGATHLIADVSGYLTN